MCAAYLGYEVLYNWQPVKNTLYHDPVLKPTTIILAPIAANIPGASPFQVGHWFIPMPCPPCTREVASASVPTLTTDADGNTVVQFGADANLSEADVERLREGALSISAYGTGERSFTYPPGAQATFENGQTTITLDAADCE